MGSHYSSERGHLPTSTISLEGNMRLFAQRDESKDQGSLL